MEQVLLSCDVIWKKYRFITLEQYDITTRVWKKLSGSTTSILPDEFDFVGQQIKLHDVCLINHENKKILLNLYPLVLYKPDINNSINRVFYAIDNMLYNNKSNTQSHTKPDVYTYRDEQVLITCSL